MPFLNTLLSIRVEVLLICIKKSLSFSGFFKLLPELILNLSLLQIHLSSVVSFKLLTSDSLLFLFLLLSDLKLLTSDLPKLTKLFLFHVFLDFLILSFFNLLLSASLDCIFHLESSSLLLFEESHGFLFSLSHLLIQNLVLSVLDVSNGFSLLINHSLSGHLLLRKLLFFFVFSKLIKSLSFSGVLFDSFFLFKFLSALLSLSSNKLNISFLEVISLINLSEFSFMLPLSFSFKFFFDLSSD